MKSYEVVIVGAGPAGLAAAIEAARFGAQVLVVDANLKAGGQLFKQIHKFFGSSMHRAGVRGMDIGVEMLRQCEQLGVEIWLDSVVIGLYQSHKVAVERAVESGKVLEVVQAKKIVIATGASENAVRFPGWTLPGIMGAGAAQTMINFNRVLPGKRVLTIGSGNVGLIVSYQLMQAGAQVKGIVEALPKINGYMVHAAKIARAGVPIYTGYTVLEARGDERVREAVIGQIDKNWNPVPGTEQVVEVDTIAIAAGLKPLTGMANMYGCQMFSDRMLGGWVPTHSISMETTQEGVYVAGDATGVEEANTAIEEGKVAGTAIAEALGYLGKEKAEELIAAAWERLNFLRDGPHGEARREAKRRQIEHYRGEEAVNL
ncbi:NAD(P)/FAD-dependent oxidoreductase [Caproiciproducens sp.]